MKRNVYIYNIYIINGSSLVTWNNKLTDGCCINWKKYSLIVSMTTSLLFNIKLGNSVFSHLWQVVVQSSLISFQNKNL